MRIHLLSILVSVCAFSTFGQIIGYSKDPRNVFDYSPAKNQTTVSSSYLMFYESQEGRFDLTESIAGRLRFTYEGRNVIIPPKTVEFVVSSQLNNGWKYEKEKARTLSIIADNESIWNGLMERVKFNKFHTVNLSFMHYNEDLSMLIPTENLLKLLTAKKVLFQLGNDKFKLSNDEMERIQRFVRLLKK